MSADQEISSLSPRVKDYFALENAARSWWDTAGHPRYDRQLDILAESVPVAGKRVLDVATGRGRFAIACARNGAREVVALDISNGMLEIARAEAVIAGVLPRIEFVRGDIEDYLLPEASFDVVNCMEVYVHFPNPRKVTRRLFRVLRPGGLLVANIDLPHTERWYFPWLNEPLRTLRHMVLETGTQALRYAYFKLLPAALRVALSTRFGWPAAPRSPLRYGSGRLAYRPKTAQEAIEALGRNPGAKLARPQDALHPIELQVFLDMLGSEGFRIDRVLREGRRFQLAYGYVVVAIR